MLEPPPRLGPLKDFFVECGRGLKTSVQEGSRTRVAILGFKTMLVEQVLPVSADPQVPVQASDWTGTRAIFLERRLDVRNVSTPLPQVRLTEFIHQIAHGLRCEQLHSSRLM